MIRSFCSFFAAALLVGSFAAHAAEPLDRIAAVVNEDIILRSELDRAVANIRSQYAGKEAQLPPAKVLERQVLERLILVRLQSEDAERNGVRISDQDIDATISGIARQNNITVDQMRQQLASQGVGFADYRKSLREELMIQRLRQRFAQGRIVVSDAEVDAALATQANGSAQYHLAHILVSLPEGATAEQIATGQKKIDGIKALLDKGDLDFNAAAVRYSDSPNALEGGDLGWRSLDQIPSSFGNTIRSMQPGQILGPIRGPSGFQLIRLQEVRNTQNADAPQMVTQYQARHILVRTPENGDDSAAKAKIDAIAAQIRGGADFAATASKLSEDGSTSSDGGYLGWFAQDDFGKEFGHAVTSLADGQVSAPFKTQAGWHILQRVSTRQTNIADENRRATVRESIGQRKLEDEWDRQMRELRGEAFIDIRIDQDAAGAG